MHYYHIARSLLSAPRLMLSLLLWPFVIGLVFSLFQLSLTTIRVHQLDESPEEYEERAVKAKPDERLLRKYLFGRAEPFENSLVCRWKGDPRTERHDNPDCVFQKYDIAIATSKPLTDNVTEYIKMYEEVSPRIHICGNCMAELTVNLIPESPQTHLKGFSAVLLYYFMEESEKRRAVDLYKNIKEEREGQKKKRGNIIFHVNGSDQPILCSGGRAKILLIFHTVSIVLVALWLALRAHRRVLDYFSKNGALLPLVAACGKKQFYKALWFITFLRVGCFLIASVPITLVVYLNYLKEDTISKFIGNPFDFFLWIVSLISATGLLMIIASIAELKDRESFFSWLYKAIPFACCFIGGFIWAGLALFGGEGLAVYKSIIIALPIFGACPTIMAPLLNLNSFALVVQVLINTMLIIWLMHYNASWFAAHLEEL